MTSDPLNPDRLWFDHNCHPRQTEPCEGCGLPVAFKLGRDWRRDWFMLDALAGHDGPDCEDCESWWSRHTPERCRELRNGMRAIQRSLTADTAAPRP